MLRAVLFDWNNTLVHLEWDDARVVEGHRAGLGADDPAFTERWRALMFGDHRYRAYEELLTELGVADPDAYIDAEHEVWRPAHEVLASAQSLLVSLRSLGLKTAVVANSWPDPGRVLRGDVVHFGLADHLDALVFSEELGLRKPDPEIFLECCRRLQVEPFEAMHVGNSLRADVAGAQAAGLTTVQAFWFAADAESSPVEPDFRAFTPMDVLNIARRLAFVTR